MSYFEILVHSLLFVDIPKDKNLPSPSHSVIFYKRIAYDKAAYEDLLVCIFFYPKLMFHLKNCCIHRVVITDFKKLKSMMLEWPPVP
jgi:hypothetical protein